MGSEDSTALSVNSGSGSAEEGVVERVSGVVSWLTYLTIGKSSARKGKE